MDRAHLALKSRAELLEHPVGLKGDPPEALGMVRIVSGVLAVLAERDRVRHLVGAAMDPHPDAEFGQPRHEPVVERGDRPGLERQPSLLATAGLDQQRVIDEVEIDLKRAPVVRDRGGWVRPRGVT